jgi:hypothetical protein
MTATIFFFSISATRLLSHWEIATFIITIFVVLLENMLNRIIVYNKRLNKKAGNDQLEEQSCIAIRRFCGRTWIDKWQHRGTISLSLAIYLAKDIKKTRVTEASRAMEILDARFLTSRPAPPPTILWEDNRDGDYDDRARHKRPRLT